MEIQRQADQWSLPDRQASYSYDFDDVRDMLGGPQIQAGMLNTREGVAKETPQGNLNLSPRKMNQQAITKAPKPPKPKPLPDDNGMDQSFVPKTQVQARIHHADYNDYNTDPNRLPKSLATDPKTMEQGGALGNSLKNNGGSLIAPAKTPANGPSPGSRAPGSENTNINNLPKSLATDPKTMEQGGSIGKALQNYGDSFINPIDLQPGSAVRNRLDQERGGGDSKSKSENQWFGGGEDSLPDLTKAQGESGNNKGNGGTGGAGGSTQTTNVNSITPGGAGGSTSSESSSGSSSSEGTGAGGGSNSGGGGSTPGAGGDSSWQLNTDTSKIGPGTYHIQEGDTLSNIAERAGLGADNYQQLADANKISNPDLIFAGDDITIPGAPSTPGAGNTPGPTSSTPETPVAGGPNLGGDLSGPATGAAPAPAEPAAPEAAPVAPTVAPPAPMAAEAAPGFEKGSSYDPPLPPRDQLRQFVSGRRYIIESARPVDPPLPPRDQLRQFAAGKRYILADSEDDDKKKGQQPIDLTDPGLTPAHAPSMTPEQVLNDKSNTFGPSQNPTPSSSEKSNGTPGLVKSQQPSQGLSTPGSADGGRYRQTIPSSSRSSAPASEAPVRTNDLAGSSVGGDSSAGEVRGGNPAAPGGASTSGDSMVSQNPSSQQDNDKQTGGTYGLEDSWSNKGGPNGTDFLTLAQPLIGAGTDMLTNIGSGIANGVGSFANELGSGIGSAIGQGISGLIP